VYCFFYFLSHSTFFKGKEKSGVFDGFIDFFKWAFSKKRVLFMIGFNYINSRDNYRHLIDFVSQMSKLSHLNLLDLTNFMMNHQFTVSFFVLT